MSCEDWADGDPTQVEEDLWDDSLLAVSLPIEVFCVYCMHKTLGEAVFFQARNDGPEIIIHVHTHCSAIVT